MSLTDCSLDASFPPSHPHYNVSLQTPHSNIHCAEPNDVQLPRPIAFAVYRLTDLFTISELHNCLEKIDLACSI